MQLPQKGLTYLYRYDLILNIIHVINVLHQNRLPYLHINIPFEATHRGQHQE